MPGTTHDETDVPRSGQGRSAEPAFPVSSGWNAFDVWWTRVRWLPDVTHAAKPELAPTAGEEPHRS